MKPAPHHLFKCAKCPTIINCWPHRAGLSVCPDCLAAVRLSNGRNVGAGQTPDAGATREVRFRDGQTYRQVYRPDHPNAPKSGWVMEHRLVMEEKLGRLLDRIEVVHHEDRNGLNNDPANLVLEASKGAHLGGEHCMEGVAARMLLYPTCACGKRAAIGEAVCWACWSKSQACPTCLRPNRKMARRDMCHGCYKKLRIREGRYHQTARPNMDT